MATPPRVRRLAADGLVIFWGQAPRAFAPLCSGDRNRTSRVITGRSLCQRDASMIFLSRLQQETLQRFTRHCKLSTLPTPASSDSSEDNHFPSSNGSPPFNSRPTFPNTAPPTEGRISPLASPKLPASSRPGADSRWRASTQGGWDTPFLQGASSGLQANRPVTLDAGLATFEAEIIPTLNDNRSVSAPKGQATRSPWQRRGVNPF